MGSSLKASVRGLEAIDRLRKLRGWNRQASVWYQTALTTLPTLKRFLDGEPIKQDAFISICQAVGAHWQDIVEESALFAAQPVKLWDGVPDVSTFYGRSEELARLSQWVGGDASTGSRCRLVALLGMSGIGKTALAAKLSEQIQHQFEYLIWRSLRHPPAAEELLDELIRFLSPPSVPPALLKDKISCLIHCLKERRVLIVLDNLETILRSGDFAGHYRDGYKSYGELLRRVGEEAHASCLLLTSREKTPEIAILEGATRPVRSLKLNGLDEAAREILKEKELTGEAQWTTLIRIYRGNPLVLQLVGASIQELFNGDVAEFLRQSMTLITGDLNNFIAQQFDRLCPLEQQITNQLAQSPEPLSLAQLQANLNSPQLLRALESLIRRSLVEQSNAGYTLQPVVMEYVQLHASEGSA